MMVYVVFGVTIAAGSISEFFFFSSRRRHTRYIGDWSSDVCSSDLRQLVLVVIAFTAARFVAMGFNRIADRELDAKNPRTRTRELPAGRLSAAQAWIAVIVAAIAFEVAAWRSEERRVGTGGRALGSA